MFYRELPLEQWRSAVDAPILVSRKNCRSSHIFHRVINFVLFIIYRIWRCLIIGVFTLTLRYNYYRTDYQRPSPASIVSGRNLTGYQEVRPVHTTPYLLAMWLALLPVTFYIFLNTLTPYIPWSLQSPPTCSRALLRYLSGGPAALPYVVWHGRGSVVATVRAGADVLLTFQRTPPNAAAASTGHAAHDHVSITGSTRGTCL